MNTQTPTRMLSPAVVASRIGIHKVTLWRKVRAGEFPKPRRIGANRIGWPETSVEGWLAALPEVG